jgi:hypothetical protein
MFLVLSFGLGILVVKDRIFGIAGILIGFIGAGALYADGYLTLYTICDPTSSPCTWTYNNVTGTDAIYLMIVIVIVDFVMLWAENDQFKPTSDYADYEYGGVP